MMYEEVDEKCYVTNATTSYCLLNSIFHHILPH